MDGGPISVGEEPAAERAVFPPPARGWLLIGVPLIGTALAIGFAVMALQGVFRLSLAQNNYPQYLAFQTWLSKLPQSEILFEIYVYAVFLGAMLLLIPRQGEQAIQIYLKRVRPVWLIAGVLIGIICAFGVIAAQVLLVQHHLVSFHENRAEKLLAPQSLSGLPLVLVMGAICAPVIEELYFRGLLLGWLRRRLHVVLASLISAVIFALMHGLYLTHPGLEGWVITGLIGTVGLVLPAMAITAQSLWPSIAVHGSYNATLLVLPFVVRAMNGS